ncbi:undecaprenyl/decaprenyl-phosphate alpha-N-acetylglucosaminyl 1-phosphate transferase [Candidatus Berkelbacteria bacterium]|nr:undecaprenyl/decaprenyl-phosphate alpha-N-acetylglucosaminyl 1-phosphate transferase [Candidatus Berkelbacteria bacterium]
MNISQLLIPFFAAVLVSLSLTPLVRKLALIWGAIAKPGGRHIHVRTTPKLGGLAIIGSFFTVVVYILITNPSQLHFVDMAILGLDANLFGVLAGALILVALGVVDDKYDLPPRVKLLFQMIATLTVVLFGVKIWWVSHPFGGPDILLGNWTYLIVPLWLLAMINVMNWFDGLDGLTSGLSIIASLAIAFLALEPFVDQPATALLAIILAGATLGFLPFNWNPASIFLGDTGSMFLGYMVGIFAIISGAKLATAALVLGIPIFDAVWVVLRRLLTGQPLMQGDRKHLHHRFLDAGFHPRTATLMLYSIAALFGLIALNTGTEGKVVALGWLVAGLVILGMLLVIKAKQNH